MDIAVAYLLEFGGDRPEDLLVNAVLTISASGKIRIAPTR
jgi:hypothetical protein